MTDAELFAKFLPWIAAQSGSAISASLAHSDPSRIWRGCLWTASSPAVVEPRNIGWIDAYAAGSSTGGRLGTVNRTHSDLSLDQWCYWTVYKYFHGSYGQSRLGPYSQLTALDGVPWEIHLIQDLTAYLYALEEYRRAQGPLQARAV